MWTVLAALLFSTTSSYILVMDFKTWENAEKHCQTKFNSSLADFTERHSDASDLLRVAQKAKLLDPWIDWSGDRNYYIGCPTDDCGRPYDQVPEPYPIGTEHPRCPVVRRNATSTQPMIDEVKCTDRRPFICNNPGIACVHNNPGICWYIIKPHQITFWYHVNAQEFYIRGFHMHVNVTTHAKKKTSIATHMNLYLVK
eukprot:517316_1